MAAVYEATDRRLRIPVALKHVVVDTRQRRSLFEHEALLLAGLRHPALPVVYDYFFRDQDAFLVMELIAGSDLHAQLAARGRAFPAEQVLRWADELLDALAYLHAQSPPIIHRDIKPQNLKVRANGNVMLLDFGLAKGAHGTARSVASSVFGYTIQYAPPEQLRDEGTDGRSDLFSLAASLYELLTSRRPPDAMKRAFALASGEPDPLKPLTTYAPHLSPALDATLRLALALDPAQRPPHAAALCQLLREVRPDEASELSAKLVEERDCLPDVSSSAVTALRLPSLPTGTVTFCFMQAAQQDALERLRDGLEQKGGAIFYQEDNKLGAAFDVATDALLAVLELARHEHALAPENTLRIALHCGVAEERYGGYTGPTVDRTLRLLQICSGGQTVLSRAVQELVSDHVPFDVTLRDLGMRRLRGMIRPEQLFELAAPGLPTDEASSAASDSTDLPSPSTPLIGREREVAAVSALVRNAPGRLVTLTGSGGTGKTRLAIEIASELAADYFDGVVFVSLEPLRDAALVIATIGHALGVRETSEGISDAVTTFLREKHMLLVIDNCEHVIAAAAEFDNLLHVCSRLTILVTSRQVLRLDGEECFTVPPLALPDITPSTGEDQVLVKAAESSAVVLFLERARAVQPGFVLTNAYAKAIAEICRQLDGLPLAIELAAARIRLFSPQALLARLESKQHRASLQFLTNASARQRTLRDTISWSYDLLDAAEQALFRQLALFAGGGSLEAIESVALLPEHEARSHLDLLISLLDKSLLRQTQQPDGEPRFVLFETIRAYAHDRLEEAGETETCAVRHASTYVSLAERAKPALHGAEQFLWLERLDREHDNLRAALTWLQSHQSDATALRLCVALAPFWVARGYLHEGTTWLHGTLQKEPGAAPLMQAEAQAALSDLYYHQSHHAESRAYAEASLKLYRAQDHQRGVAWMLHNLARVQPDRAAAEQMFEESLALFRSLYDTAGIAAVLNEIGSIALWHSNHALARQYKEQSLALYQKAGDHARAAHVLFLLGQVILAQGDVETARERIAESVVLSRSMRHWLALAWSLQLLGEAESQQGDFVAAHAAFAESLELCQRLGDRDGVAWALFNQGRTFVREGRPKEVIRPLKQSLEQFRDRGVSNGIAWSLTFLGRAAVDSGDLALAETFYTESILLQQRHNNMGGLNASLDGWASIAAVQGQFERAVALWAAAATLRESLNAPLAKSERTLVEHEINSVRERMSEEVFAAAWASGKRLDADRAVENALSRA